MYRILKVLGLVALSASLTACGAAAVHKEAAEATTQVHAGYEEHRAKLDAEMSRPVEQGRQLQNPWVSTRTITAQLPLPPVFTKPASLSIPVETPVDVITQMVAERMGVDVVIERDVFRNPELDDMQGQATTDSTGNNSLSPFGATSTNTLDTYNVNKRSTPSYTVFYKGDYRGLVGHLAAKMEARWRYDHQNRQVIFYRYVTEVFRVRALPGDTNLTNRVGVNSTDGETNSANQSEIGGTFSVWDELEESVEKLLSPEGAAQVSEATGQVTVRDLPDNVARIRKHIDTFNESASYEVIMEVGIYSITRDKEDNRAINWNAMYDNGTAIAEMVTSRGLAAAQDLSFLKLGVNPNDGSSFAGSEAFIDSLQRFGDVDLVTSGTLRTVNNALAPMRIGETIYYLASSSTTNTADVGSTQSLELDQVNVGFNLNVVPQIQDNGRNLLMHVGLTISALEDLKTIESGDSVVQAPYLTEREVLERVWLTDGETLVLAGFELVSQKLNKRGIVTADSWVFGGGRSLETSRTSIIVVIKPRVRKI